MLLSVALLPGSLRLGRVALAESAYAARKLLEGNDKYRRLLAATHDEDSVAGLSAQVTQVEEQFTRSLRDAIETGQLLALPA